MSDLEKYIKSPCGKAKVASLTPEEKVVFDDTLKSVDDAGYLNKGTPQEWSPSNKWLNAGFELFMGKLLANVSTQVVGAGGNASMAAVQIIEQVMAVPVSKMITLVSDKDPMLGIEAYAPTLGLIEGLSEARNFLNAVASHVSNSDESIAENMGLPDALEDNKKLFMENAAITPEAFGAEREWTTAALRVAGRFARLPGQVLTTVDLAFKVVNYYTSINTQSARIAASEFQAARRLDPELKFDRGAYKLRRDELKAYALQDPEDPIAKQAVEYADKATFVNKPDSKWGRLAADKQLAGVRWAAPIRRVPVNVAARGWERTLISVADPRIRKELRSEDIAVSSNAYSRIAFSTMVMMLINGAVGDNMVGSGPEDPNSRDLWHASGFTEDSFVFRPASGPVAIGYKYFPTLEPMLKTLAAARQILNKKHYIEKHPEYLEEKGEDEITSIYTDIALAFANSMVGELWMKDINIALDGIMDMMNHRDPRKTLKLLASRASTMAVGNLVYQQGTKRADPVKRESDAIWDELIRKIPWLSKSLPAAIDPWGNEVLWASDVNPETTDGLDIYGKDGNPVGADPVVTELRRIRFAIPEMSRERLGVRLTGEEFEAFQRYAGAGLYDAVKARMLSIDWSDQTAAGRNVRVLATDSARRLRIRGLFMDSRKAAVGALSKDPRFNFAERVQLESNKKAARESKRLAEEYTK